MIATKKAKPQPVPHGGPAVAAYQLHYLGTLVIQHMADGSQRQIPMSESNGDYLSYLAWLAVPGNVPDPADPAPLPDPQEVADLAVLSGLGPLYQNLIDGLNAIEATKTSLDAHAATLSTITVSGTLVATQAQLQGTLRALGTDLGIMVANIDKLARGSETVLQTLAALKRNVGR